MSKVKKSLYNVKISDFLILALWNLKRNIFIVALSGSNSQSLNKHFMLMSIILVKSYSTLSPFIVLALNIRELQM